MKFQAAFTGRKKNAIGIFYNIADTCEGKDEQEATSNLYERYEHIQRLVLTPIEEPLTRYQKMFLDAYIEAALCLSNDDKDRPLDKEYSKSDIDEAALKTMRDDCLKFYAENEAVILVDPSQAGNDFWLTRNRHGAGFWDGDWAEYGDALTKAAHKYKECSLYVGDDNKVYLM